MKKINEIFYSIQGEGCHTGIPSVFVRFSGCNLKCWFCDTDHSSGKMMTDEDIVNEINLYPAEWIILTGGEPALFIDENFIKFLKKETRKKIAIETNGTVELPNNIDWITISPKNQVKGNILRELVPKRADEVKVVYESQDLEEYFSYPFITEKTQFCLQPCFVEDKEEYQKNIDNTIKKVLSDPRWRLSMQLHKILGIQ